jgi:hypothetical protein
MAQKSAKPHRKDTAWRVDGISPEAATAAEQAAAREGVALSAWLSRLIRDTATRERAERNQESGAVKSGWARHRAPSG